MRNAYIILVGKPEEKGQLGKLYLKGIEWLVVCGLDSSGSRQGALAGPC